MSQGQKRIERFLAIIHTQCVQRKYLTLYFFYYHVICKFNHQYEFFLQFMEYLLLHHYVMHCRGGGNKGDD